jgi:hypothetical protein
MFFLLVCTRINRKVFQRVSKPTTLLLSMWEASNLVHSIVAMSLCFVDGHCKSESHRNSEGISVGIVGMCGHSTSSPLNFPFKIVVSMILFIIFFTGHLVTVHLVTGHWSLGHLVAWSLSRLVINFFERTHYNYAKFHNNYHRVQLITWSLVTWSLSHLENFPFEIVASMILFIIFFTGHLVINLY